MASQDSKAETNNTKANEPELEGKKRKKFLKNVFDYSIHVKFYHPRLGIEPFGVRKIG